MRITNNIIIPSDLLDEITEGSYKKDTKTLSGKTFFINFSLNIKMRVPKNGAEWNGKYVYRCSNRNYLLNAFSSGCSKHSLHQQWIIDKLN